MKKLYELIKNGTIEYLKYANLDFEPSMIQILVTLDLYGGENIVCKYSLENNKYVFCSVLSKNKINEERKNYFLCENSDWLDEEYFCNKIIDYKNDNFIKNICDMSEKIKNSKK